MPLAVTLRPHAPKRMHQAVGVVDVIEIGPHLGAEPAVGDRMIRIGVEFERSIVLDLGDDAAGVGAVVRAGAVNAKCQRRPPSEL